MPLDWDGMEVFSRFLRVLVLAVASTVTSLGAASAALWSLGRSLPPTDGAYGMTLAETWSDPFVATAALLLSLGGGALGFVLALTWLWRTDLMMESPVDDLDAWWQRISSRDLPAKFGVATPKPPAMQPWGLHIAYVADPAGVLWHPPAAPRVLLPVAASPVRDRHPAPRP